MTKAFIFYFIFFNDTAYENALFNKRYTRFNIQIDPKLELKLLH